MTGLSAPNMSFAEAEVKVPKPAIGKYSWLKAGSVFTLTSAYIPPFISLFDTLEAQSGC